MAKLTITLLFSLMLVLGTPNQTLTSWSYPFNSSTVRTYTADLALIAVIDEWGPDGGQTFDGEANPQDSVTLYGAADEGDIYLIPLHPTCWTVRITSDAPLLNWTRRSVLPCRRTYVPMVTHGW